MALSKPKFKPIMKLNHYTDWFCDSIAIIRFHFPKKIVFNAHSMRFDSLYIPFVLCSEKERKKSIESH